MTHWQEMTHWQKMRAAYRTARREMEEGANIKEAIRMYLSVRNIQRSVDAKESSKKSPVKERRVRLVTTDSDKKARRKFIEIHRKEMKEKFRKKNENSPSILKNKVSED